MPIAFRANVCVNQDAGTAEQDWPSIAVDRSGTLHVLWADDRSGHFDIWYTRSEDGGMVWSEENKVSDDIVADADSFEPDVVVDSAGNLHTVWCDNRNGDYDIYYSHLISGTTTWSPNVRVDDGPAGVSQLRATLAVAQSGTIHAVWADWRAGHRDVRHATSDDHGATWSPSVKVNDDGGNSQQTNPRIGLDRTGHAHAVWGDTRNGNEDIYAAKRDASTGTWSPNVKVNDDLGEASQYMPDVAVHGSGTAHAVWFDYRNWESDIYHARLISGTTTWTQNTIVNNPAVANKQRARVAAHVSGAVHTVWYDRRYGSYDIFYARLDGGGSTWGDDVKVNDDTGNAKQSGPSLALGKENLPYAVWMDERGGDVDIFFSRGVELSRQIYCPVVLRSPWNGEK